MRPRPLCLLILPLIACGTPTTEPTEVEVADMPMDMPQTTPDIPMDLTSPDLPVEDLVEDVSPELGEDASVEEMDGGMDATEDMVAPTGRVPAFVAVGQGGRSVLSCDGGRTWRHDRFENESNDDHAPLTAKGLAYGDGVFVAGFGWGAPGRAWVSQDAVTWTETLPPMGSGLGDVVYGDGVFLLSLGRTFYSSPDGQAWTQAGDAPRGMGFQHVRGMGYADGTFFVGGSEMLLRSTDRGQTWALASQFEPACVEGVGRRGGWAWDGDRTIVVNGSGGTVCWSQDQGQTWTSVELGAGLSGNIVWSGEGFLIGAGRSVWRSPDGMNWRQVMLDGRPDIRYVAHGDGVFVGISRDGDRAWRSEDGDAWAPADMPPSGTDLVTVRFGHITPTSECP